MNSIPRWDKNPGWVDPTYFLYTDRGYAGLAVEADESLLPLLQQNLPAKAVAKVSRWRKGWQQGGTARTDPGVRGACVYSLCHAFF